MTATSRKHCETLETAVKTKTSLPLPWISNSKAPLPSLREAPAPSSQQQAQLEDEGSYCGPTFKTGTAPRCRVQEVGLNVAYPEGKNRRQLQDDLNQP
jgi:hypothetical protein